MEMKDIGKRIHRKRIEKGWCQEELAEKVDLSASYIGMIEIANVLEVSADELLCGVVDHGYEIRMSEYTKRIGKISQEKRKLIYSLLDFFLSQEE